jgi:hypothetical protein
VDPEQAVLRIWSPDPGAKAHEKMDLPGIFPSKALLLYMKRKNQIEA